MCSHSSLECITHSIPRVCHNRAVSLKSINKSVLKIKALIEFVSVIYILLQMCQFM